MINILIESGYNSEEIGDSLLFGQVLWEFVFPIMVFIYFIVLVFFLLWSLIDMIFKIGVENELKTRNILNRVEIKLLIDDYLYKTITVDKLSDCDDCNMPKLSKDAKFCEHCGAEYKDRKVLKIVV